MCEYDKIDSDFKKLYTVGADFNPFKVAWFDIETFTGGFKPDKIHIIGSNTPFGPKSTFGIESALSRLHADGGLLMIANDHDISHRLRKEEPKYTLPMPDLHFDTYPHTEDCDTPTVGGKIGRNCPCLCGSGKKYKFCCLKRK